MTSFIVLSKSFISQTFNLKLGLEPHTRTGGEKDHTPIITPPLSAVPTSERWCKRKWLNS